MASFHDRLMDAYDLLDGASDRLTEVGYRARRDRLADVGDCIDIYEDPECRAEHTFADRQALRDRIGAGLRFATEGLR